MKVFLGVLLTSLFLLTSTTYSSAQQSCTDDIENAERLLVEKYGEIEVGMAF